LPFAALLAATLGSPALAQQPCTSPLEWRRVNEGAFSLELPAALVRVDTSGEDSQVGAFESQTMRVAYDYGSWRLWLGDDLQRPGPHQESVLIDGHRATIISAAHDLRGRNEYRRVQAVQFELLPTERASRNRFLTVTVRLKEACDDAAARRIVESIRFE
jgi:hypothetical protein